MGSISDNPNLATQSWANYWNNNEGACIPCASMTNIMNITGGNVCQGGTALLSAGTNAVAPTYLWSTGETTANISITRAGTYSVTISQSDGCTKNTSITVGACAVVDTNSCRYKDSLALVTLYDSTQGDRWLNTIRNEKKWKTPNVPITNWYGVYTNAAGCVVGLDFDGVDDGSGNHNSGNLLRGTLPDAVFNMSALKTLFLSGNPMNVLPNAVGRLNNLTNLHLERCGLTVLPDSLWTLRQLEGLNISQNAFNAPFPSRIGQLTNLYYLLIHNSGWTNETAGGNALVSLQTLKKLGYLDASANNFSGTLSPTIWTIDSISSVILRNNRLTSLGTATPRRTVLFDVQDNRLTSALNFTPLPIQTGDANWGGLRLKGNQLTFTHILPSMGIASRANRFFYSPQDSVFIPTTLTGRAGDPLSINLNFDDTVRSNSYQWRKIRGVNDTIIVGTTTANSLFFRRLQASDAGVYEVRVTNSIATQLTLYSRKITIVVTPNTTCRYLDSFALVDFYRATNMQNATPQYRWNLDTLMTTWKGVGLNANGCVECLDLDGDASVCNGYSDNPPGVGLSGVFPSAIGRLTSLYRLHLRGNRGLTGSIPDSIRYLTNLAALYIDDTGLTGALPDGFQYLTALEDFTANNTPFGAPIPNFFSRIKKMDSFDFTNTKTSGTFPVSLANVDSLRRLYLGKNTMSGRVPIELSSRLLHRFDISNNRFDSLPKLNLVEWRLAFVGTPYFYVQGNRLTFDDILPNLAILPASFLKNYGNQDSIFQKITYTKNVGETLTVNLGIDGALTTNKYLWFKNGIRFDSSNSNTLILRGLQMCDAATYRVEVSNPNAPQLTLYSYDIRLVVNGTTATRTLDTAFCNVPSYRLPNDSLVRTNGTYRGTLKNIRGCDSLMWTVKTTFNSNPTAAIIGRDTQCSVETITLRATGGGTYLWSNGITADSIQVSNVGTFSVTITNAAGCTSVLSKTIVRNPALSSDATTNHITCAGRDDGRLSVIPIGGTPNFTYNWTGPNGFLSRSQNLANLKKGDYWLTVTDARGCSVASNLPLSILEPDSLKIGAASIQNTTCQQNNGAININTITGGTGNRLFSWNNNVTTQNLSNITAGTYTLSVRDVYNCTATANYVVANVGTPKNTPLSISACSGDSVRGRLVTATTSWTETFRTFQNCDSLVNVAVIITPTTVQTTNPSICAGERHTLPDGQIVSNAGTYRGRLVGTCGNFVVNLTILPIQTISKTDSFCQNGFYDLPNRRVTLAGTYVDTLTAASGCKTRYQTTLTYRKDILRTVNATFCKGDSFRLPDNRSVNTEGSYISRKTSATSCDTVITTTLTFRPVVEAFDDEVTLNIGDSATINLLINDNLGSFGGRTTIIKAPTEGTAQRITDSIIRYKSPQILRGPLQVLTYRVCMIGCTNNCDSASLRIMLKDKDNDFGRIKNGVATEMQGDEFFEVDSISAYPKAQLYIYNGWDELVFKSAIPYDNRWSGTSQNGEPLPSGVYYYVLRDAAPNRKQLDGKILLLR